MKQIFQKLLVLYLSNSTPCSKVIGWSVYDGAGEDRFEAFGEESTPPYATAFDAMKDGWRIIQFPELKSIHLNQPYELDYLEHEFVLEKLVEKEVSHA